MTNEPSPILRVENLSLQFPKIQVLKNISFSLKRGEFAVFIGPSGAGKSSLLRCINGLYRATSGHIWFEGEDITLFTEKQMRRIRRRMGMIFQNFNVLKPLTARTNVLTGRLGYLPPFPSAIGIFPHSDIQRAEELLQRVRMEEKIHQPVKFLSGGQQQRVAIARALMQTPSLLLADEPVSNLDPVTAERILNLLKEIHEKEHLTVLASLHDVRLAKEVAHSLLGIRKGTLLFHLPPEQVTEKDIQALYYEEI